MMAMIFSGEMGWRNNGQVRSRNFGQSGIPGERLVLHRYYGREVFYEVGRGKCQ